VIDGLRRDLTEGEHGLRGVPTAVKLVIRDEMWQERVVRQTGEVATFDRFDAFVLALPPKGLGADLPLLKRICASDPEAIDLIDKATANPKHIHTDADNVSITPQGNSAQAAIRRLRKDRPDLHADVIAGKVSPHGAMVAAGFRPKTWTAPADPAALARAIRRRLAPAEVAALIDELGAD